MNKAEQMHHEANAEISRLNRELQKLKHDSDAEINRLNREMQKSKRDHDVDISRLHQDVEAIQRSRDDAVTKLSSTLETLQTTCVNAQNYENKLNESEDMLQQAFNAQKDLKERVGLESERVS
jgi:seryl-tRNA synthetase